MQNAASLVFILVQIAAALIYLKVAFYSGIFRKYAKQEGSHVTPIYTAVFLLAIGGLADVAFWGGYALLGLINIQVSAVLAVLVNAGIKIIPAMLVDRLWGILIEK